MVHVPGDIRETTSAIATRDSHSDGKASGAWTTTKWRQKGLQ